MILPSSRPTADVAEQQWATLSFVPEDLPWFDWIIRQIEGYPVPAELAGAPTRFGFDLPAKLTLFPDRWNPLNFETYDSALETSRFLVVVISPNSAESSWIEDQMQAFRGCGGEERIVALVVDCRPDGGGGNGTTDWLPQWLARRLGENGFAPAGLTEPVVIDARGAGEKLDKARESLLASLLTTTCQELERMGGLAPPLDLLPQIAQPAPAAKPEAQPATGVPNSPRYSRKMIPIAACTALLLFGSGWFLGRATAPAPVPPPVDVSHKRRPNIPASAAATIPAPAVTAPSTQIADATKTDDSAAVPKATTVTNAADIVALPSPVPESAVAAATTSTTVVAAPKPDASASPNADPPPAQNAAETIALSKPAPEPPGAVPAPKSDSAPPSKPVASTSPNPELSLVRSATPTTNAAETVALPLPVPSRPVPAPASAPLLSPAVGSALNPETSSQLARSSALPAIVREQTAPAEQTEREQIEHEQRRRDDEALRAQWLSQVAAADMALRKGKMMQATDFYNAAMATAERYAARRSDDVSSLTEMARLCHKLGAMQLQTVSVGEARATFERGRRFLALLKSSGQLTPAHAQILRELETSLQTLPRD